MSTKDLAYLFWGITAKLNRATDTTTAIARKEELRKCFDANCDSFSLFSEMVQQNKSRCDTNDSITVTLRERVRFERELNVRLADLSG